ncbi:uncharacterized protein Z520_09275 [Fonsecaea multimorphosa CBS 102226]|uniref:Zn(2)-C6 fungal-type domain-containing protein n=1 Tax=Fonsecaea multimorphosa CBS 102226 TaxID=1442371 RepID=A0A0D2GZL4_9EURO|nr:uncharacterized protein Z520_09275 [Fonsecaea multimorphosa CBS 102226]KIX94965.1 hypothetical protein Z520_09275 [Fonsecaea multimorphosa CBS 102226]OAL20616.1 hypothetical protein AYO22_08625 [Fonsecaea multimorphosa]
MANLLECTVTQKRSRRHAPKVRTGCVTCKVRKIRCDEKKPSCERCTSTGRRCDGYVVLKPLLFEIPQDKDERWGFYYFRDRTSKQLLSLSRHDFWNRLVIQAGYSRGIVRHALVAIASYHESVDNPDHFRQLDRQRFAIWQYNKAIKSLLDAGIHGDIEDVLLASILFTFFENVRGMLSNALVHLHAGLRVLTEWRSLHGSWDKVKPSTRFVEEHLAPILGHLQDLAATLMPIRPDRLKITSTDPPECFQSLQESHFYFNKIVHGLCSSLQHVHERDTWPYGDQSIIHDGRVVLWAWYNSFTKFLGEVRHNVHLCSTHSSPCHFEVGACYLQMQFWAAIIRLESTIYRSEMVFDSHLSEFQALLDMTTRLADMLDMEEAAGADACLGFPVEYLAVAAFIALRCRESVIRRGAIGLMRSHPRLEGIWQNTVAADLAEFIVTLEETDSATNDFPSCHDIPEHSRLQLLACNFLLYDKRSERFRMVYGVSSPDVIKIRVIRSGIRPVDQDFETFWIGLRPEQSMVMREDSLPSDVSGLFPQIVETESNLWRQIDNGKLAEYLERSAASHICGNIKGIQGGHQ